MGKATQDLRKEHDSILHVLKIMDKMISADTKGDNTKPQYYNELVYFLKIFADKCHHGKEENFLFAELIKKGVPNEGGPVGVMLKEHNLGREYIALMNKALESKDLTEFNTAAAKYRNLLLSHIEKENNVLFVMADQLLDEDMQDKLYQDFEQHEESVIGHGVHEELHSMIHKWSEKFEV
ncbi:hemerythrin domain-containing protein [Pelotomaculum propionicicum]|uniref:hemerythrin domain-containing protein n=1 Tax=Pelotomaculum propionicicum TaxID=258475 RepID=UPI003B772AB5